MFAYCSKLKSDQCTTENLPTSPTYLLQMLLKNLTDNAKNLAANAKIEDMSRLFKNHMAGKQDVKNALSGVMVCLSFTLIKYESGSHSTVKQNDSILGRVWLGMYLYFLSVKVTGHELERYSVRSSCLR